MIKNKNLGNRKENLSKIPLFTGKDKLKGRVDIKLDRRRKVDHLGIKVIIMRSN
jgi:hypothetical protein